MLIKNLSMFISCSIAVSQNLFSELQKTKQLIFDFIKLKAV